MTIRTTLTAAALALTAIAGHTAIAPANAEAACGWYAIGSCTAKSSGYPRNPMSWAVVNTSRIGNFRNGYYCIASGPQTKAGARRDRNRLRNRWGIRSAYIKRGCE